MGCEIVKIGDAVSFACGRGVGRPRKCAYCSRPSSKLCDFVTSYREEGLAQVPSACDAPLCGPCAKSVGPGRDHCRAHGLRGEQEAKP